MQYHHPIEMTYLHVFATLGVVLLLLAGLMRRDRSKYLSVMPGVILGSFCLVAFLGLVRTVLPKSTENTFDLRLYYVDGSLGLEPSMWLQQTIGYGLFGKLLEVVYESWPLAIALACSLWIGEGKQARRAVLAFALSCIFGIACYYVVPACGPGYLRGPAFAMAPFSSPDTASLNPTLIDMPMTYDRNCMPSLHVTWALLVALLCNDSRRWRWVGWSFAFLTAIAAMWNGEHYLVDIVAAFPFAYALGHLCFSRYQAAESRYIRAFLGASSFAIWILLVRNNPELFWLYPVVCWSLALAMAGMAVCDSLFIRPIRSTRVLAKVHRAPGRAAHVPS